MATLQDLLNAAQTAAGNAEPEGAHDMYDNTLRNPAGTVTGRIIVEGPELQSLPAESGPGDDDGDGGEPAPIPEPVEEPEEEPLPLAAKLVEPDDMPAGVTIHAAKAMRFDNVLEARAHVREIRPVWTRDAKILQAIETTDGDAVIDVRSMGGTCWIGFIEKPEASNVVHIDTANAEREVLQQLADGVEVEEETTDYAITEQFHTKRRVTFYQVELASRVSPQLFKLLRVACIAGDGWGNKPYRGKRGGFAFKTEAQAQAFAREYLGGNQISEVTTADDRLWGHR